MRAARIFGAADALREMIGSAATPVELAEYQQELSALQEKLDRSEFEKAWEEGRRLNMDEAILLAVQED